jgi:hypothetical protein
LEAVQIVQLVKLSKNYEIYKVTYQTRKSANWRWISHLTMCCPVPSPVPNIAATGADGALEPLSDWLLVDFGQKPLLKFGKSLTFPNWY